MKITKEQKFSLWTQTKNHKDQIFCCYCEKVVNKGLILKSARAGFANMMNIQGYGDRCIQMWMGRHLGDIQSKHYIQRRMVWYEPPKR